MLALEIRVNGELKAVCGDDALDSLGVWLRALRKGATSAKDFDLEFSCQGHRNVDAENGEILKWVHARAKIGDAFTVRFVEVERAHEPIDRQMFKKQVPPDA